MPTSPRGLLERVFRGAKFPVALTVCRWPASWSSHRNCQFNPIFRPTRDWSEARRGDELSQTEEGDPVRVRPVPITRTHSHKTDRLPHTKTRGGAGKGGEWRAILRYLGHGERSPMPEFDRDGRGRGDLVKRRGVRCRQAGLHCITGLQPRPS